jgi:hypothetical protein
MRGFTRRHSTETENSTEARRPGSKPPPLASAILQDSGPTGPEMAVFAQPQPMDVSL